MTPHETHDTISVLVQDAKGDLSGACTTSGWAYKMHGEREIVQSLDQLIC